MHILTSLYTRPFLFIVCLIFILSITHIAKAQQPNEPPQEAFSACSGKDTNSSCSFTGARGETVSGYCITIPENKLVCSPNTDPVAASSVMSDTEKPVTSSVADTPTADVTSLPQGATQLPESELTFWQKLFNFFFGWLINDEMITSVSDESEATEASTDTQSQETDTAKPGMADPSAVYCEEQGGTYELQGGRCNLNGIECSSWDFFRTKVCESTKTDDAASNPEDSTDTVSISGSWTIPDTGQTKCYDNDSVISCPSSAIKSFYGQDGNYSGTQMSYTDKATTPIKK